jgi:hypothetical protein
MKQKPISCMNADLCDCETLLKQSCQDCKFYGFIDSGYGACKALPTIITVPWCKDICSFFKESE